MKHIIMYFSCLLFLVACSRKEKTVFQDANEMMAYLSKPSNGFVKKADVPGPLTISVRIQPDQLLPRYDSADSMLVNNLYFVLSFSVNGKELLSQLPQEQYSSLLQTFSFGMQPYISAIIEGGEKLDTEGVFFNPTYGAARANNLLLVFNRTQSLKGDQLQIVLKDFGLGFGQQVFAFDTERLKQVLQFRLINQIQ